FLRISRPATHYRTILRSAIWSFFSSTSTPSSGCSPRVERLVARQTLTREINWVWLLFGNEKSREKSGDFGRCRRGDGRKLPGYRGEGGISPGLALPFLVFSAGSRWRWAFCETPCIC